MVDSSGPRHGQRVETPGQPKARFSSTSASAGAARFREGPSMLRQASFRCPAGHRWDESTDEYLDPSRQTATCPRCGSSGERIETTVESSRVGQESTADLLDDLPPPPRLARIAPQFEPASTLLGVSPPG